MVRKPGQVRTGTGKEVTLGLREVTFQVAPHDKPPSFASSEDGRRTGEAERRRQPHAGFPPPAWVGEMRKTHDNHKPRYQGRTPDGKGEMGGFGS